MSDAPVAADFDRLLDPLLDRASVSALRDPAPTGAMLDRILETALRAPDHGRLTPWRLLLIRGDARQRLADQVAKALRAREPGIADALVERQRSKFLHAPLVIALGARIVPDHKIPQSEQLMSVAAAAMNLLNAIHMAGFGAIWLTGANSYDPSVQAALGLSAPDMLAGFLFVGTVAEPARPARRPALDDHVAEWTGEPARWPADVRAG